MSTLNFSGSQSISNWRDMVKYLEKVNAKFQQNLPIMTRYEAASINADIVERKEYYRRFIETGVVGMLEDAKASYKSSLKDVEAQKAKITNSWDASKLAPELQIFSMRIDKAAKDGDRAALEVIYAEAKNSGDRYKQRAAAEAIQNAIEKVPANAQDSHGTSMRRAVNLMQKTAADDLAQLQTSPELQAAQQKAAAVVEEINAARISIADAARAFREEAPNGTILNTKLQKALDSIRVGEDGNPEIVEERPPTPPDFGVGSDHEIINGV